MEENGCQGDPGARNGLLRAGLWLLAVVSVGAGTWALFLPRLFYEDLPLPGRGWVSALGPYNEHLVRDVGALYLALAVPLAGAAIFLERRLVQVALVTWLVSAVPHFVYHMTMLHHFPLLVDKAEQVVGYGFVVLLPLILLGRIGIAANDRAMR